MPIRSTFNRKATGIEPSWWQSNAINMVFPDNSSGFKPMRGAIGNFHQGQHHRHFHQYSNNSGHGKGDEVPNNEIATATDSSKKFEAPIIPAGAAMQCARFSLRAEEIGNKEDKEKSAKIRVWAISRICKGFSRITFP